MRIPFICFFMMLTCFLNNKINAQELNCTIIINSDQIQTTDKKIFQTLKNDMTEFMNTFRFTNDVFKVEERIEVTFLISITERLAVDRFKGTISVTARRPVFKTDYKTQIFNHLDEDFVFNYVEYQPFEFNPNNFGTNLTAVLGFYAYLVLGIDYDTFSIEGGTPYFQLAQTVVNNAQSAQAIFTGWRSSENLKNRYWLVESFMSANFKLLRKAYYNYHRLGMDIMSEKTTDARKIIADCIKELETLHNRIPGSNLMRLFFMAKQQEVIEIFTPSDDSEKNKVYQSLILIDPGNTAKYEKLRN
jgi:hypothetical protein